MLSSDYKLRYYKDSDAANGGVYKGEIDLRYVDKLDNNYVHKSTPSLQEFSRNIVRFNKDIIIGMQKVNRVWSLQADTVPDAEAWTAVLNQLVYYFEQSSNALGSDKELLPSFPDEEGVEDSQVDDDDDIIIDTAVDYQR